MKLQNGWLLYYEDNLNTGERPLIRIDAPGDNHCLLVRRDRFPDHSMGNMFYDMCDAMLKEQGATQ